MSKPSIDLYDIARFFSKVDVRDQNSCWYFKGKKTTRGYGGITIQGEHIYAHRLSYKLFCGEVDSRQLIRHKCDNPSCVNPWHLSAGSHLDNMLDRTIRGRNPAGERNGRAKLNDSDVLRILADPRAAHKVAADYAVGKDAILRIRNGESWTHITKGVPVAAYRGKPVVPVRHRYERQLAEDHDE